MAILRISSANNVLWQSAYVHQSNLKGLSIDSVEQNFYVGVVGSPAAIIKCSTTTGSIISGINISSYNSYSDDIKIYILSNNADYFINLHDPSYYAAICKYIATTNTMNCLKFPSINSYSHGSLKLTDSHLFLMGKDDSTVTLFHLFKINFTTSSYDWANKITCSSDCSPYLAESILSSDYSRIYSMFTLETPAYLYFITLNATSGSIIGSRYRSSVFCSQCLMSLQSSNLLLFTATCSSDYLFIFDTNLLAFTVKKEINISLYGIALELTTRRIIYAGNYGTDGYITKFSYTLISQHTDFTSSSITMNVLSSGSYDVVTETGIPALVPMSLSSSPVSYGNQSYTFVQNYTTDIYYQTDVQSISVTEKTSTQVLPDLTCSLSSSTSIVFSLSSSNNEGVPSCVTINASTGLLTIVSPEVDQDTNYSFYVNAAITGVSQQTQKLIKLTVKDCSTCGSQTAKALSITVQSLVAATIIISMATAILNAVSISSIWSLINQVQLFFLLLLTRAYIPDDVKLIITGLKFALNLPSYFSFSLIPSYNSVLDNFNFDLSNYSLSYVEVNSDSSLYNSASFLITMLIMIVVHAFFLTLHILLSKCRTDCNCSCFIKIIKWIILKICHFLTFGYYIRVVLGMNQYLLICSVYEIYIFNTTQLLKIISLLFATLLLIVCIIISIFTFYLSISSYTVDESKHNKLGEFFCGLKMEHKFKLYSFMLILRRTVFTVLFVTCITVASRLLIGVLILFQLIYLAYVCYLRPFKEYKDNIVEIVNETYFLSLLSFLIYLNTESYWSSTIISIYMWTISSNSMVLFIITIIDAVQALTIKCRKCCSKTSDQRTFKVEPKQVIPTINVRDRTNNSSNQLNSNASKEPISIKRKIYLRDGYNHEEDEKSSSINVFKNRHLTDDSRNSRIIHAHN